MYPSTGSPSLSVAANPDEFRKGLGEPGYLQILEYELGGWPLLSVGEIILRRAAKSAALSADA